MNNIDNITIGELKALAPLLGLVTPQSTAPNTAEVSCGLKIVILQRGWVCVGQYIKHGDERRLENASVIRVWGTTKGIGELAASGPLKSTKLDPAGTVRFHHLAEVATIDCDASKWPS
jgi:hypothetical protein